MNTTTEMISAPWEGWKKILFRFVCIFFILYIFPFPVASLPFLSGWNNTINRAWTGFWHAVVPWIGDNVLHLPDRITTFSNGSGDTTYDYVTMFTLLVLALAGSILWTLLDGKRVHYQQALTWLSIYVRYYLAYVLFSYGFSKVFYVQMTPPTMYELIQPFGDKSPMGLAWSYVGYSKAFSIITGWAEVAGAVLLLFRKTLTVGALFNLFVLGNVVIMNFCFDVPVKLYSSMLWLMNLFLLAPDLRRITGIFFQNKAALPLTHTYYLQGRWKLAGTIVKWTFFVLVIYSNVSNRLERQSSFGVGRVKPPLYGLYKISSFVRNNDTLPLLMDEPGLWKNLVIEFRKNAVVKYANDSMERFMFVVDTSRSVVSISPFFNRKDSSVLKYVQQDSTLQLTGKLNKDSVNIRMKQIDGRQFRLINRGFHWINERPYHY